MPPVQPILCSHLLRKVDTKLLELLPALLPDEWDLPTVSPQWRVRDVAAHLLDTVLRKLSFVRDQCTFATVPVRSQQDVALLVHRLNAEGVIVFRRLSPPVLCELMALACRQSADFHESLDPFALATFNVSWAGEAQSLNWFDTARELTERWHHQQQIRLATNRPGIMTPELYRPVLDCFARGLPFHYRGVAAKEGTTVQLRISRDCGGRWQLRRRATKWELEVPENDECNACLTVPQEIAWRLFTKGMSHADAFSQVSIEGNYDLAFPILKLTAIVA